MLALQKALTVGFITGAPNRYKSFAKPHENSRAKFYIDGHDYFSDLAEAMMAAKQSIMVADWMLSPEVTEF